MEQHPTISALKLLLRRKRLSINWASRILEVSHTQLQRLLNGDANPDLEMIGKMNVVVEALRHLEKIAI